MFSTLDDIRMTTKEIDRINKELEQMDPNDPDNRFRYANKKSEINILYKKLYELREKLKFEKEENNNTNKKILRRS